jgi:hypothetical protein
MQLLPSRPEWLKKMPPSSVLTLLGLATIIVSGNILYQYKRGANLHASKVNSTVRPLIKIQTLRENYSLRILTAKVAPSIQVTTMSWRNIPSLSKL